MRKRRLEAAEWEQQHGKPVDPTEFEREIRPLLQGVPLARLVQGTGLSLRYVSQIRRGERVPHPRHWTRFESLAGSDARGAATRGVRA
jgi:hypothetical protein